VDAEECSTSRREKAPRVIFLATNERLAADQGAWSAGPELPRSHRGVALSVLLSGRLLATAGMHGGSGGFDHLGDALIFDPTAST